LFILVLKLQLRRLVARSQNNRHGKSLLNAG
jgi:hypothetical protein